MMSGRGITSSSRSMLLPSWNSDTSVRNDTNANRSSWDNAWARHAALDKRDRHNWVGICYDKSPHFRTKPPKTSSHSVEQRKRKHQITRPPVWLKLSLPFPGGKLCLTDIAFSMNNTSSTIDTISFGSGVMVSVTASCNHPESTDFFWHGNKET